MPQRTFLADTETPVSLFLTLAEGATHAALFESVEGGERWARRSLIALDARETFVAKTIEDVRALFDRMPPPERVGSPLEGVFGWFSYEAAQAFLPVRDLPAGDGPVSEFFRPRAVLLYDHHKHTVELHTADTAVEAAIVARLAAPRTRAEIVEPPPASVRRQFSAADYRARALRAKEYIAAGDAFQIVLSQKLTIPAPKSLFDAYRQLRRTNPSPYLYYVRTPTIEAAGASPETLVRVEDEMIRVRPIAGTRGRGATDKEDRALEAELLADPKERAEHLMLVDLGRNDVGRVSEPGSVRVEPMMVVERYSHVMHIVSEVSGRLAKDKNALEAFASVFPAGTLSGAPKKRAMEIIAELEGTPRGLYGGAVGYFSSRRSCDFAIAIRTISRRPGGEAVVQAGAGIVYDSEPEAENQECLRKAASPLASVNAKVSE